MASDGCAALKVDLLSLHDVAKAKKRLVGLRRREELQRRKASGRVRRRLGVVGRKRTVRDVSRCGQQRSSQGETGCDDDGLLEMRR